MWAHNQYQAYREWAVITMLDIKLPKQVYQFSTNKYQAYKDESNMNMQDI